LLAAAQCLPAPHASSEMRLARLRRASSLFLDRRQLFTPACYLADRHQRLLEAPQPLHGGRDLFRECLLASPFAPELVVHLREPILDFGKPLPCFALCFFRIGQAAPQLLGTFASRQERRSKHALPGLEYAANFPL